MARYRKKPVAIDAVRVEWQSPMPEEPPLLWVLRWAESFGADTSDWVLAPDRIEVPTLEGVMTAQRGDYLIRGVQGEFYPCKPEIFHQTYEEVEAE